MLALFVVGCNDPAQSVSQVGHKATSTTTDAEGDAPKAPVTPPSSEVQAPAPAPPVKEPPPEPKPVDPAPEEAGECPERKARDADVGLMVSPRRPEVGETVTVVAATLDGEDALAINVLGGDGRSVKTTAVFRRGVPSAVVATFVPREAKAMTAVVGRKGKGLNCLKFRVRRRVKKKVPDPETDLVWKASRKWSRAEEALYSAWVRELFHGPPHEDLSWRALTEVTGDRKRNFLHGYVGWDEDAALKLTPDCADTPYFLRAYFAWKRGLPFGFRHCSRGNDGKAPRCFDLQGNLQVPDLKETWINGEEEYDALLMIERFFRKTVGWGVHTGNGRTAFGDHASDFYPLELSRRALRPGTIYADPYGHIFVLVEFVAAQGGRPGLLLAIDGQPDASITRKRFWQGNFLWNPDPKLGGSGFKAFRPLVVESVEGVDTLVPLGDAALRKSKHYGDVSDEQAKLDPDAFYDKMDSIISPGTRDAEQTMVWLVDALAEAARVRVRSVQNGVDWVSKHPDEAIEMPEGYSIFETTGAWENYSTPARDLRLLIALDVVEGFEAKLARQPEAFGLRPDQDLGAITSQIRERKELLLRGLERAISYRRSDGSEWTVLLSELMDRRKALETAYNPNDCPEVRWAAPKGSEEMSTCQRRAPAPQRNKMRAYRSWFSQRRRPARGDPGPQVPGVDRPADP